MQQSSMQTYPLEQSNQTQAKIDPALLRQPLQQSQQQPPTFHNLTAPASKQGAQPAPPTTRVEIQIPVPSTKTPGNGTAAKPDSITKPVRGEKKDKQSKATSLKSKLARQRKAIANAVPGQTIVLDASSSSASSSDYSSESETEQAITPETSPLPATRPAERVAAARYDAMKAVWMPRNRRTTAANIRIALVAFGSLIKGMRDSWKTNTEAVKDATAKDDEARQRQLSTQVAEDKQAFSTAIDTAMAWGHPAILQRFQMMTLFTTMDQATLEKTKVSKILPRLVKKGGETTKKLAEQVLQNVALETKRRAAQQLLDAATADAKKKKTSKADPSKTGKPATAVKPVARDAQAPPATATQAARQPPSSASSKRERDGDEQGRQPVKRVAQGAAMQRGKPSGNAGQGTVSKPYTGTAGLSSASSSASSRSKATITVQKPAAPSSLFSNLMSASKRPGTSNAARAAAAAAAKERGEVPAKKPAAASKAAFSFSSTMADLTKPKDAAPAKEEGKVPPNETEEQKALRLKKEKKNKLRVRFKDDKDLVEIRLFTHDPEEEARTDPSMVKDVDDIGGEGRMLKLHLGEAGLDDSDEDDEVAELKEEVLRPWPGLVAIDFSVFTEKERQTNYIKHGGVLLPDSAEKAAQDKRVGTSLPPLRTSIADIPESPKEPPETDGDEPADAPEPTAFGEPSELIKARSDQHNADRGRDMSTSQASSEVPPAANLSALLGLFGPAPQPSNAAAAPVNPLASLESTFSRFRSAAPPGAAPAPPTQPLLGSAAPGTVGGLDLTNLLAVFGASQQVAASAATIPPRPPQQMLGAQDPTAILGQLASSAGLAQAGPVKSTYGQGSAAPPAQIYENEDRKRLREEGLPQSGRSKRSKGEGKKKVSGARLIANHQPRYF
ncbi:hypothetical protein KEM52_005963 [Ascosphaera acerosa]|nr:hypothetical protein KEM52_005963 [Ascosphaera acerosa]